MRIFFWTDITYGEHSITAIATDSAGGSYSSMPRKINVLASTLPKVSITSPANGDSFKFGSDIEIATDASDPDGIITKIEFYSDSVKLGEISEEPFTFLWDSATGGSYTLTVKATDNTEQTVVSEPVTITVEELKYLHYYIEDFNDNQAQNWEVLGGSWNAKDSLFRNSTIDGVENSVYNGNIFENYTFSVKANPDMNNYFGMLFNYQDEENYYLLGLDAYPSIAFLRKIENGTESTLRQEVYSGGGAGVWLNLDLINEDSTTIVKINDNVVINKISTTEFTKGRIGLYTYGNSLWFDDVSVSAKWMEDYVETSLVQLNGPVVNIYPNPINGNHFFVKCESPHINSELNVYDISGRLVLSKKINKELISISTNYFSRTGIYILEIINEETIYKTKIIIN